MKIVVFGGGRGCTNIIKSLFVQTNYSVSIMVNAYDNGKSTGRIRKFIPGLLGPSDIRKNVSTLLECYEKPELSEFLEFRLGSNKNGLGLLHFIRSSASVAFATLTFAQFEAINAALTQFERFENTLGEKFDTQDCAVGNLVIAGLYLQCDRNFNRAIQHYQQIFLPYSSRFLVFNVSDGENLYLVAKSEAGNIFTDESEIVSNEAAESIREIGLVAGEKEPIPHSIFSNPYQPQPNPEVISRIGHADIIVYGPGTQASSLLPSYLTHDLLDTIAGNETATKIFISNLIPDFDDPLSNIASRLNSFYRLSSKVMPTLEMSRLITHVFSELPLTSGVSDFISFNTDTILFQTDNWLVESNRHLGPAIVRQISKAVGNDFYFKPGFVSLVINNSSGYPEASQLADLINSSGIDLDSEILLISHANSLIPDEATKFRKSLPNAVQEKIRFVPTLEEALKVARGDLIAYLEDANLYLSSDFLRGIELMQKSSANLVLGSRNLKILDLKKQVRSAYPGQPVRGFIAYWGSLSLSLSFLFKYRRFISDPLAGIKIIRRSALVDCDLSKIDKDININLLKNFVQREYLIEQFEIGYRPENLTDTNRHNFRQGVRSLFRIWSGFF
jgi:2-phospho-L-lactate transferase/gluconeogenesis factor (CofD/UPF0052 family)